MNPGIHMISPAAVMCVPALVLIPFFQYQAGAHCAATTPALLGNLPPETIGSRG